MFQCTLSPKKGLLGLDLGAHAIKLVALIRKGKKCLLTTLVHYPCSSPYLQKDGVVAIDVLTNMLQEIAKNTPLPTPYLVLSIADTWTTHARIAISTEKSYLTQEEQIYLAMETHTPYQAHEIYLHFEMEAQNEAYVIATYQKIVDSRVQAIKAAGFIPVAVEMESFALARIFRWLYQKEGISIPFLLIDLGWQSIRLYLMDVKGCHFYGEYPLPPYVHLTKAIVLAIEPYLQKLPWIEKIVVIGGRAKMQHIEKIIQKETAISTTIPICIIPSLSYQETSISSAFFLALGLALRKGEL